MDLFPHPDRQHDDPVERVKGEKSLTSRIVIGVLIALVVVVIVLHLTGVVGPLAK